MSLKTFGDGVRERLDEQQLVRDRTADLTATFEKLSEEEKITLWVDLIERTKRVLNAAGLAQFTPYDGHYNAKSEGNQVQISEKDTVITTLQFNISHEQEAGTYHPYDNGVRWLTLIQNFSRAGDPNVSIEGKVLHLNPIDFFDRLPLGLPIYTEGLSLAETALDIG